MRDRAAELPYVGAMRREPGRRDLTWRLRLDEQVIYGGKRLAELRNFIEALPKPHGASRLRG
jgi:GMP synthase (glutamine-hydrolysing)